MSQEGASHSAKLPRIECSVTFLTPEEGGRSKPFPSEGLSGDRYRPHVVIGEPTQPHPIVVDGKSVEEYIGVAFNLGPEAPRAGVETVVLLTAMYYPIRCTTGSSRASRLRCEKGHRW